MSVMTRFTRRTLAKNRVRTVVSALGIALSCALLVAVFTSVSTLQNYLLVRTVASEGAWQIMSASATQDEIDALASDDHVTAWATRDFAGSAGFSDNDADRLGDFLGVEMLLGNDATGLLPSGDRMREGRLPVSAGEVSLPDYLANHSVDNAAGVRLVDDADGDGSLSLGDTIELDLVARYAAANDAGAPELVTQRSRLDKDYYLASDMPIGPIEWSEPLETARLTIVGFHYPDYTTASEAAVVLAGTLPAVASDAYAATDFSSYAEIKAFGDGLFGEGAYSLHASLLSYQGMTDDRAIWQTLFNLGAILAAVIIIASVSLIYNAFAISVAERTRQFGLLSSLGASKRQLRRSVLAEAGMLASAGIPAGVALGLAGTAAVFAITGEGWASMLGSVDARELPSITLDAGYIALSVGLSLLTIFVSAWVPAMRAGRVSATDAIRQTQDVKLSRRARRSLSRAARNTRRASSSDPKMRTALFGTPGFIAKRNLSRNGSKGRVAVASLAVSVVLLVTAGSISMFMNQLVGVANQTTGVDIQVTLNPDYQAYEDAGRDPSRSETARDVAAEADRAWEDLQGVAGIEGYAYSLTTSIFAIVPADMIDASQTDRMLGQEYLPVAYAERSGDGSMRVLANVQFVDDATWHKIVDEQGLPAEKFCDPDSPVALAANRVDGSESGRYVTYRPFSDAGQIDLLSIAQRGGLEFSGLGFDDGEAFVSYSNGGTDGEAAGRQAADASDAADAGGIVPLGEVLEDAGALSVGALLDEAPDALFSSAFPCLYLPMSAFDRFSDLAVSSPSATIGLVAPDSLAAEDAVHEYFAGDNLVSAYVYNADEGERQANLMNWTIQVFLWCFTAICALIAVANVFNTVSTSFILRRREFAVLRSVGMGGASFRCMVVRECLSYAARGLVIGLAFSVLVTLFMYLAMGLSMADLAFTMPWAFVGGACGLVLAVLVASVVYALRKAQAHNVIEALRDDAV